MDKELLEAIQIWLGNYIEGIMEMNQILNNKGIEEIICPQCKRVSFSTRDEGGRISHIIFHCPWHGNFIIKTQDIKKVLRNRS